MRWLAAVLVLLALTAGAQDVDNLRAGESANGFPNWAERVIHQWINRARVDPQFEMARCGGNCPEARCYTPQPPLAWSEALNRAARFHSDEMSEQGYFAHDSACTLTPNIDNLYPVGCDGDASCACVGGTRTCKTGQCTSWPDRVSMFGMRAAGEIIHSASEPDQAFYDWLFEPAPDLGCGFNQYNGHRWTILKTSGSVGVGVARMSVGDFSFNGGTRGIVSGSHYPRQAQSVEVWANWYETAAPRSASVVVDGTCMAMKLARGTGPNGAWMASVPNMGSGCHRYYFSFIDASGAEVTYPATGTLGIGGATCADFSATRAVAKCGSPTSTRHRSARK
jgi:hypothetical protein